MNDYLDSILDDVFEISENSTKNFNEFYDGIVRAIQNGFAKTDINVDKFFIYPIGEYDYGTTIEELIPYKIVFEYSCKKSKLTQRINYLKLRAKKKLSMKNQIIMKSMEDSTSKVFTNSELAQLIENFIKKSDLEAMTTIKQNSVLIRIKREEKIYDFVVIIAYKFEKEEDLDIEGNNIVFKYKSQTYEMDYEKFITNLETKQEETNGIYLDMIVLYKYMEFYLLLENKVNYKTLTEFNLYENLLYNVPNDLYTEDLYQTTINTLNFIYNANPKNLITVDGGKFAKSKLEEDTFNQQRDYIKHTVTTFIKEQLEILNSEENLEE